MGPKRIAAVAVVAMLAGAAPSARAAVPDLETTSATQLEAMLNAGQLTSVELTQAYIDRIAAVNRRGPALNAVRALNPDALHEARVSDLARRTGIRAPARRAAGAAQGQHRRGRDPDHGVLDRARALGARQGRVHRPAPEGRGRGDPRQGQPDRVRRLGLEQPVQRQRLAQRAGAQPVRHLGRSGRFLGRLGRRRGLGPGGADDRHRHRGLDHLARDPERRGRHPAVHRPVVAHRDRADLGVPGHAGAARADGLRRRAAAERRDRARPRGRAHRRRAARASTTRPG